jgi:phosphoribosylformylglycinamidine synthase
VRAKIRITLKSGVLDPQGKAIEGALGALGFPGARFVRLGNYIELDRAAADATEARRELERMCAQLLANTVIENYQIDIQ